MFPKVKAFSDLDKGISSFRKALFDLFRSLNSDSEKSASALDPYFFKKRIEEFELPKPVSDKEKKEGKNLCLMLRKKGEKETALLLEALLFNHYEQHRLIRGAIEALLNLAWEEKKEEIGTTIDEIEKRVQKRFCEIEREREEIYPEFNACFAQLESGVRQQTLPGISSLFSKSRTYFKALYTSYLNLREQLEAWVFFQEDQRDIESRVAPPKAFEGIASYSKEVVSEINAYRESLLSAIDEAERFEDKGAKASLKGYVKESKKDFLENLYRLIQIGVFQTQELKKISASKENGLADLAKYLQVQANIISQNGRQCDLLQNRFQGTIDF